MSPPTLFVVNPTAGSGRVAGVWERLAGRAFELAPGAEVVRAEAPGAAVRELDGWLAERAVAGDGCRVVAVGGDGTVHLVTNRLAARGRLGDVDLGLVPAGTGSDLARTLGLPGDPQAALERALSVPPRRVDVLRLTAGEVTRLVLNVASAGISGLVAGRVNLRRKRHPAVYLTATLGALARYRGFRARVRCDSELWHEGGVFLLAVANGPTFGKGMRVAPEARIDDGLADLVLIRTMPRWQVPLRLPRLYVGSILESPVTRWRRCLRVEVEADGPLPPLEVDGETLPGGDFTVEVLPAALSVLGLGGGPAGAGEG